MELPSQIQPLLELAKSARRQAPEISPEQAARNAENVAYWDDIEGSRRIDSDPRIGLIGKEGIDVSANPLHESEDVNQVDLTEIVDPVNLVDAMPTPEKSSRKKELAGIVGSVVLGGLAGGFAGKGEDRFNPFAAAAGAVAGGATGAGLAVIGRRRNRKTGKTNTDEVHEQSTEDVQPVDLSKPIQMKKGINESDVYNNLNVWATLSPDEQEEFTRLHGAIEDIQRANPEQYLITGEYKNAYSAYHSLLATIIERNQDLQIPDIKYNKKQREVLSELDKLTAEAASMKAAFKNDPYVLKSVREAHDAKNKEHYKLWKDNKDLFAAPEIISSSEPQADSELKDTETKEKISTAKKVLIGAGVIAVAAGAVYLGKDRIPEGVKEKVADTAKGAVAKTRNVTETVSAAVPSRETLTHGIKRTGSQVEALYERAKDSDITSKAKKTAVNAFVSAKNVRRRK